MILISHRGAAVRAATTSRASMEHIAPWLAARFAGEAPVSVCAATLAQ